MGVDRDPDGGVVRGSYAFGAAFGFTYVLAWALRGLRWLTGADGSATPWRVVSCVLAAVLVTSAVGWAIWRVRERRTGARGSLVDAARRGWRPCW